MQSETIAYFSMEIALEPAMPTYSGGLGMLAGDTVRSAADLKVPMVAVTLLHRKGYFNQKLDQSGWQTEAPAEWPVEKYCEELRPRAQVTIEGRTVHLRAWRYGVKGVTWPRGARDFARYGPAGEFRVGSDVDTLPLRR